LLSGLSFFPFRKKRKKKGLKGCKRERLFPIKSAWLLHFRVTCSFSGQARFTAGGISSNGFLLARTFSFILFLNPTI